ncbi:MAG TPA: DUF4037 domain-containing protein [Microlunatus sp.]
MSIPPKGLDLARTFYAEVVRKIIAVPHTACLIGEGSEVLGYDTERSTDHEWGPRLQMFVDAGDVMPLRDRLEAALPSTHRDHPVRWFSLAAGTTTHHIEVDTTKSWLGHHLPTIPFDGPDTAAWLAVPQQHLLQLTAGEVFHDDLGQLTNLRQTFRWYPLDVWRWMIATQWHLIGNAEPLAARAFEAGDERGARVLIGRLCRLIMEMTFLQEQQYRPYDKWFGSGFAALSGSAAIGPLIDTALHERPSSRSDGPLQQALLQLGDRHNHLRITASVDPRITDFAVGTNDAVRPFPVLNTAAYIDATVDAITDPAVRELPRVGTIDQLTHADDTLINFTDWPAAIARAYRARLGADVDR